MVNLRLTALFAIKETLISSPLANRLRAAATTVATHSGTTVVACSLAILQSICRLRMGAATVATHRGAVVVASIFSGILTTIIAGCSAQLKLHYFRSLFLGCCAPSDQVRGLVTYCTCSASLCITFRVLWLPYCARGCLTSYLCTPTDFPTQLTTDVCRYEAKCNMTITGMTARLTTTTTTFTTLHHIMTTSSTSWASHHARGAGRTSTTSDDDESVPAGPLQRRAYHHCGSRGSCLLTLSFAHLVAHPRIRRH